MIMSMFKGAMIFIFIYASGTEKINTVWCLTVGNTFPILAHIEVLKSS